MIIIDLHSLTSICWHFQMKHCDDLGILADKSSTIYMVIGIFASLGRIGGGFLCDLKFVNSRLLLQASIFIMAASTMLLTLAKTYFGVFTYAIFFSSADGLMITSMIVETLKAVKEDEKASAVGLLMLFSGISALIGPPLSGRGPILSFHFYTPPPSGGLRIYPPLFTSYIRGNYEICSYGDSLPLQKSHN